MAKSEDGILEVTDAGGGAGVDVNIVSPIPLPVSAASLPLPTGASTSALQTQPGVDIGDVTVNNAAGAAAVNIQDGGNIITVDSVDLDIRNLVFATDKVDASGSIGVGVTGPLTDTQLRATPVPVTGNKTNNISVPGIDHVAALVAVSTDLAPDYDDGVLNPLSLNAKGQLRIQSGSFIEPRPSQSLTIGVVSAEILGLTLDRRGMKIINLSNNKISFGLGEVAVLDSGITLYPGGVWNMDEYDWTIVPIEAIASGAGSVIGVQEWTTP